MGEPMFLGCNVRHGYVVVLPCSAAGTTLVLVPVLPGRFIGAARLSEFLGCVKHTSSFLGLNMRPRCVRLLCRNAAFKDASAADIAGLPVVHRKCPDDTRQAAQTRQNVGFHPELFGVLGLLCNPQQ